MKKAKKIIIANWKMNPQTPAEAKNLFAGIVRKTRSVRGVAIGVCPPLIQLPILAESYRGKKIQLGAQDVFWEKKGSFTGFVSAAQVCNAGGTLSIVGHSERRAHGETNAMVHKKVAAALKEGLQVVLCVGERERDERGTYLSFVREEVEAAVRGVSAHNLSRIVIAYEPIWAIGKSAKDALRPSQVHEMSLFIKKVLAEKYGKKRGTDVPVLYGGSVEPSNAESIMTGGKVNGFLVGHASLNEKTFSKIVHTVSACRP